MLTFVQPLMALLMHDFLAVYENNGYDACAFVAKQPTATVKYSKVTLAV